MSSRGMVGGGGYPLLNIGRIPIEINTDVLLPYYRSGTVDSKSFVAKVLLRIKWKFELN